MESPEGKPAISVLRLPVESKIEILPEFGVAVPDSLTRKCPVGVPMILIGRLRPDANTDVVCALAVPSASKMQTSNKNEILRNRPSFK